MFERKRPEMFERFSTQKFRHEVFEKSYNRNIFRLKCSKIFQPKRSKNVRLEMFKKIRPEVFQNISIRGIRKVFDPKCSKNFQPKGSKKIRPRMFEKHPARNARIFFECSSFRIIEKN